MLFQIISYFFLHSFFQWLLHFKNILSLMFCQMLLSAILPSVHVGNEVTRCPGQEASLAPPCSTLRSFRIKCTVLKEVLVTLLWLFSIPTVIRRPENRAPLVPHLLLPCMCGILWERSLSWKNESLTAARVRRHITAMICFVQKFNWPWSNVGRHVSRNRQHKI